MSSASDATPTFDLYRLFKLRGQPRLVVQQDHQSDTTIEYRFDPSTPGLKLTQVFVTPEGRLEHRYSYDPEANSYTVDTGSELQVVQLDDLGRQTTEHMYGTDGQLRGHGATERHDDQEHYTYDLVADDGKRHRFLDSKRTLDDRGRVTIVVERNPTGTKTLRSYGHENDLVSFEMRHEEDPRKKLAILRYHYVFGWEGNWTGRRIASYDEITMRATILQLTTRRYEPPD